MKQADQRELPKPLFPVVFSPVLQQTAVPTLQGRAKVRPGQAWDDRPPGSPGTEGFLGPQLPVCKPGRSPAPWNGCSPVSGVRLPPGSPESGCKDLVQVLRNGKTNVPNACCTRPPISRAPRSNPWSSPTLFHKWETEAQTHTAGTQQSLGLKHTGTSEPKAHTRNLSTQTAHFFLSFFFFF